MNYSVSFTYLISNNFSPPVCKYTGINQPEFNACSGRNAFGGGDASCKVRLPVFGLASYKLRNSIFNSKGAKERQQVEPLWEAAENWLKHLKVDDHYDFNFFVSQNSKRRWWWHRCFRSKNRMLCVVILLRITCKVISRLQRDGWAKSGEYRFFRSNQCFFHITSIVSQ